MYEREVLSMNKMFSFGPNFLSATSIAGGQSYLI
jgi:hypothetical protein